MLVVPATIGALFAGLSLVAALQPPANIGPINTESESLASVIRKVHDVYWLDNELRNASLSNYLAPGHQVTHKMIRDAIPTTWFRRGKEPIIKATLHAIAKEMVKQGLLTQSVGAEMELEVDKYETITLKNDSLKKLGIFEQSGGAWNLGYDKVSAILKNMAWELVDAQEDITTEMLNYYRALEAKYPFVGHHPLLTINGGPTNDNVTFPDKEVGPVHSSGESSHRNVIIALVALVIVLLVVVVVLVLKRRKQNANILPPFNVPPPAYGFSEKHPNLTQPPPTISQNKMQSAQQ